MNAPLTLGLRQLILDALRNTSSDKPISETELHSCSFADYNYQQILDELEALYEAKKILRVLIVREGLGQSYYWINLMASRMPKVLSSRDINIRTTPARRDDIPVFVSETTAAQPAPQPRQESPQMTIDTRPKAVQILEFIEQNPKCTAGAMKAITPNPDAFIGGYIKRNEVIKSREPGSKSTYALKAGCKTADIYRAPGNALGHSPVSKPDNSVAEQPAQAPAEPKKPIETTDLPVAILPEPAEQYGQFKAAYTSAGTLMLFGLSFQPIELSKEKTTDLFEFLNQQLSLIGL